MSAEHKQKSRLSPVTKSNGNGAMAPLAGIADGVPSVNAILPEPRAQRSRISKTLVVRAFQSLDATVLAAAAIFGCLLASDMPLAQTAFGVAAPFLVMPFFLIWGLAAFGAYRFDQSEKVYVQLAKPLGALIGLQAFVLITARLAGMPEMAFVALAQVGGLTVGVLFFLHALYAGLMRHWGNSGAMARNVVIVGATKNAQRLVHQSETCKDLNVVAVFDDRASRRPGKMGKVPVAGSVEDLMVWDGLHNIDKIIITVTSTASRRVNELIDQLRELPQEVVLFMDLDGFNPEQARLTEIARAPMAYVSGAPQDEFRIFAKRVQDIAFASAMLIAFAPIMAVIAVLIRLDSPGPVIFRQKRHGFNNRVIEVMKFRSMKVSSDTGPMKQVQKNDSRITRIGRFLRRTSLDELPQLFNVLGGSMSLVGPRPHAVGMRTGNIESWKLVAHYAHRHRVKPGLTGWAQINGSRGPLDTPEQVRTRVRLDLEYINRAGFWFDLLIMLKTGPCLLGDSEAIR